MQAGLFSNLVILALVAGLFIPLQTGVNAQLARTLGNPVLASLVSFTVGSAALLAFALLSGVRFPNLSELVQGSWTQWSWTQWTGGLLGAFFVTAMVILAPRLGVATTIALVITGQMIGSMAIDHFGLMGVLPHAVSVWRVIGTLLMISGVILIQVF